MRRWLPFILLTAFSIILFAQPSTSYEPMSTIKGPPKTAGNPVMSADDFKNAVSTIGQQNQADLKQQFKQQLDEAKKTAPQIPAPPSQTPESDNMSTPDTAARQSSAPSSPQSPARAPAYAAPAATQQPVYTGFGGSNQTGTTNNNASGNTGLGIKY